MRCRKMCIFWTLLLSFHITHPPPEFWLKPCCEGRGREGAPTCWHLTTLCYYLNYKLIIPLKIVLTDTSRLLHVGDLIGAFFVYIFYFFGGLTIRMSWLLMLDSILVKVFVHKHKNKREEHHACCCCCFCCCVLLLSPSSLSSALLLWVEMGSFAPSFHPRDVWLLFGDWLIFTSEYFNVCDPYIVSSGRFRANTLSFLILIAICWLNAIIIQPSHAHHWIVSKSQRQLFFNESCDVHGVLYCYLKPTLGFLNRESMRTLIKWWLKTETLPGCCSCWPFSWAWWGNNNEQRWQGRQQHHKSINLWPQQATCF